MPETLRCPDCGHPNPSDSTACAACNFPLQSETAPVSDRPSAGPTAPGHGSGGPQTTEPASGPASEPEIILPRPIRRARPRPASNQALSLWLMFAFIAAAAVIFVAVKANLDRASQPVEGSNVDQQKQADQFRAALAKDSTDVEARIGVANVLYDTGNWSEAIVQYRSAIRQDSTRTTAIVDMGVCYYNLGDTEEAERLFNFALARDPHQAVALYNLGIVRERRNDFAGALSYYHRALESGPPEGMRQPLIDAMTRMQQKTGKVAPPLPDGR